MLAGSVRLSAAARCLFTASFAIACLLGCGPDEKPAPAPAVEQRLRSGLPAEVAANLREDAEAVRSPSDGGGRVVMDPPAGPVRIDELHRFRFVYTAGPLGIAEGGALYFQVSPFFGWSRIQVTHPDLAGYTTCSTTAEGVQLQMQRLDNPYLLPIAIRGRALREGETIEVVYGAGERGAQVDRFAERGERFWFHVDGDGDRIRGTIADSPSLDIAPGPPAQLVLSWPATARPGDRVTLTAALLDPHGNRIEGVDAEAALVERPAGVELPATLRFEASQRGVARIEAAVVGEGVARVRARVEGIGEAGAVEAESNPLLVVADAPRLLWADVHGHTNWSDGTGVPEDYFLYARDVAGLDVAALTDHDHWGTPFLDAAPERWQAIREITEAFHAPGRFVTILGFEWTNWSYGHRHVLYFDGTGDVLSSLDAKSETPQQLWDALRGRAAMTIAHHSAGGPVPVDWSIPPDPVLEPTTEVASVHGSSEAPDSPLPIYDAVEGNWVRDQLAKGYRLGFIGSSDSHDGHPGLAQLMTPSSGLAAIQSEEKTRGGVLEALRARRTYATNGPRIVLRTSLAGHRMGEVVPLADLARGEVELVVQAIAPAPLARVDVIHGREVVQRIDAEGRREVLLRWAVPPLRSGDFVYVRVVQQDGGAAWSSPWFIE